MSRWIGKAASPSPSDITSATGPRVAVPPSYDDRATVESSRNVHRPTRALPLNKIRSRADEDDSCQSHVGLRRIAPAFSIEMQAKHKIRMQFGVYETARRRISL